MLPAGCPAQAPTDRMLHDPPWFQANRGTVGSPDHLFRVGPDRDRIGRSDKVVPGNSPGCSYPDMAVDLLL
jgi:hypothetical protein